MIFVENGDWHPIYVAMIGTLKGNQAIQTHICATCKVEPKYNKFWNIALKIWVRDPIPVIKI